MDIEATHNREICPCGVLKTVDDSPQSNCAQAGGLYEETKRRCTSEECNDKRIDKKISATAISDTVSIWSEGAIDLDKGRESSAPNSGQPVAFVDANKIPR